MRSTSSKTVIKTSLDSGRSPGDEVLQRIREDLKRLRIPVRVL